MIDGQIERIEDATRERVEAVVRELRGLAAFLAATAREQFALADNVEQLGGGEHDIDRIVDELYEYWTRYRGASNEVRAPTSPNGTRAVTAVSDALGALRRARRMRDLPCAGAEHAGWASPTRAAYLYRRPGGLWDALCAACLRAEATPEQVAALDRDGAP